MILRRTIYEGKMDNVKWITYEKMNLKGTICKGNMQKEGHLRGKQF